MYRFFFFFAIFIFAEIAFCQDRIPTQSVADYLEVRKLAKPGESNYQARKRIFESKFPAAGSFSGTSEQNTKLLRQLLFEEQNSAALLRRCFIESCVTDDRSESSPPATIQVLVGGFGWGARDKLPPDLWKLNEDKTVVGEPNLIAAIFDQEIRADWSEAKMIVDAIKKRVSARKERPVVLIGHSFGASGIVQVANRLSAEGIEVDLAIAIDAVNSMNVSGVFTSELAFPPTTGAVVHIGAGENHWALHISKISNSIADYRIQDTDHTDIDRAPETFDIIHYLLKQLPKKGINHYGPISAAEYKRVAPPQKLEEFPSSLQEKWKGKVSVVRPEE